MRLERLFAGLSLSSSGLSAQRKKMNAIAANIANAETTRTADGGPYRRKVVEFSAGEGSPFASALGSSMDMQQTDATHLTGGPWGATGDDPAPAVTANETDDPTPFITVHDPGHPDADADGFVKMPNVNIVTEMVDMMSASRAYEANVVAITAAKNMAKDSLEI
jgi:flagellar basal-body rod protein FlgC